jgi:hypothetical protein
MIAALTNEREHVDGAGYFYDMAVKPQPTLIGNGYFSGAVSVSFSAFDPFNPPQDRNDEASQLRYSYIGLKEVLSNGKSRTSKHKDLPDLAQDFLSSLMGCFGLSLKRGAGLLRSASWSPTRTSVKWTWPVWSKSTTRKTLKSVLQRSS